MNGADLSELIGLLEARLRVIGDADLRDSDPESQLAQLKAVSEAIVAFPGKHRAAIQPKLSPFLESCSYAKALDWASDALGKG